MRFLMVRWQSLQGKWHRRSDCSVSLLARERTSLSRIIREHGQQLANELAGGN